MNKSLLKLKVFNLKDIKEWNGVPWRRVFMFVRKLQKRIYSASKANDMRKIRRLQKMLVRSYSAKLLAVRRVTQDNTGKKTAGVDGVKSLTPAQRLVLAQQIRIGSGSSPIRRVWIPKPGKLEKRPLGIPVMRDRALQALMKMALEPEWEARFETNSYGFRPGRSCHDAMRSIVNGIQKKAKYVLDADIAKCFDRIDQQALLDKLKLKGSFRAQIKSWLKAGVLDDGNFFATEMGTPQGGIISPLLANIALHGMELRLKEYVSTIKLLNPSGKQYSANRREGTLNVIRYADDFVVMHERLDIVLKCKEIISEFLAGMGLELSPTKTRITHTLTLTEQEKEDFGVEKPGFQFLGFEVRQFYSKYKSAYVNGQALGYHTMITPSNDKVYEHIRLLGGIIRKKKSLSQIELIRLLNPMISAWRNYFGVSHALQAGILQKMDHLLYLKLRAWAKRKGVVGKGYWKQVGDRLWVFGPKNSKIQLATYAEHKHSLNDYVKVKGDASPFDGNEIYWVTRLGKNPKFSATISKLLKRQEGRCNMCKLYFNNSDVFEIDHIIPRSRGGKEEMGNIQLLHRHCHDTKTALDLRGR